MWLPRSITAVSVAGLLVGGPVLTVPSFSGPVLGSASSTAPHPVATDSYDVALAGGAAVSAPAADTAVAPGTVVKDVTVGAGSLVGVSLDGTPASTPQDVSVRVQDDDGTWGEWTSLDVDGGPDPGTREARHASNATDPLWIGDTDGDDDRHVQVMLPKAAVADASLSVVEPGTSRADAAVTRPAALSTASAATTSAPAIHPRKDWGADESLRNCPPQYMSTVRDAALHHTDGTNDYTPAQVPGIIRGIYAYHTQVHGWCDIGYNVLVDKFGGIWEGRAGGLDKAVLGAHTGGFNDGTFGVSMLGDFTSQAPTDAQMEAVARVMAWKLGGAYRNPLSTVTLTSEGGGTSKYAAGVRVTLPTIFAHRDVGSTECPGDDAYALLPALRQRVAALIGTPSGVLYDGWKARGGESGFLGSPSVTESSTPDGLGRYTHFTGGSLYWTAGTGVHDVRGAIRGAWASLGWEGSVLGYPTTDETATPDGVGRYNHFQGGSVYWSPATGAHEIHGAIRADWAGLGWEGSALGYPTTNETKTPDGIGRYEHFQGGSVYWTPSTGAHAVQGAIRGEWASLGWEGSALGYPTTDEAKTPDGVGRYNHFTDGSVYWTPTTGAHAVSGAIGARWASLGWEHSALGYPTGDPQTAAGTTTQTFQHGTITATTTGATKVTSKR